MNWIALMISSTFFTGFLPGKILGRAGAGGGLMGSLVGFALQVWIVKSGAAKDAATDCLIIFGSFALGLIFIQVAEEFMLKTWGPGKRHTSEIVEHDRNQTNIDEVHGMAVAGLPVFLLPMSSEFGQYVMLIVALVAFRLFDVLKPWPIRTVEKRLKGALGIMLDDTVAGIMAAFVVLLVIVVLQNYPVL